VGGRGCSWEETYRALDAITTEELVRDQGVVEVVASKRIVRIGAQGFSFYLVGVGPHIHLVLPRIYCSCVNFSINVVSRCSKPFCVHLAAVELAERRRLFREVSIGIGEASKIASSVLEAEATPYIPYIQV